MDGLQSLIFRTGLIIVSRIFIVTGRIHSFHINLVTPDVVLCPHWNFPFDYSSNLNRCNTKLSRSQAPIQVGSQVGIPWQTNMELEGEEDGDGDASVTCMYKVCPSPERLFCCILQPTASIEVSFDYVLVRMDATRLKKISSEKPRGQGSLPTLRPHFLSVSDGKTRAEPFLGCPTQIKLLIPYIGIRIHIHGI